MTFTKPKTAADLVSGCTFLWDAEAVLPEEATNGTFLTLNFTILDNAAAGTYNVELKTVGTIDDNDLLPVDYIIQNGAISIQ